MTYLGARIRYLRKQDGLTQQQLADALGIGKSTISMYENGQREPDFETLESFADHFNVNMSTFFPNGTAEVVFDDFTYAMHNETKDLPQEKKDMLLSMARFMRQEEESKKGD